MNNYGNKRSFGSNSGRSGGGYRDNDRSDRGGSSYPRSNYNDRDSRGGGSFDKPSFKVVCDDCGKNTTVPFEPSNNKPIYCRDCFEKHGGDQKKERSFDRPRPSFESRSELRSGGSDTKVQDRLIEIEKKLDTILKALDDKEVKKPKKVEEPKKVKE